MAHQHSNEENEEQVRRLHTAIMALRPDLDLPLPQNHTPQAVAELLGVLTALTDQLAHQQAEYVGHSVATYNQVLGHRRDSDDYRTAMYERFAERVRFIGLALTPVGGRGVVTMANGCLVAAYEGLRIGAEFEPKLDEADPDQTIPQDTREQVNERLVKAQQYMEKAREGVALIAGYPGGVPPTEDQGQVLESDDERITQIIDMGTSIVVDYAFTTPDGPVRTRGQALLDDVVELIGLTSTERADMIVAMVESNVDQMESQFLHTPPGQEG